MMNEHGDVREEAPLELFRVSTDLSDEDKATCKAVLQGIQRDLNCLSDDNRLVRKRAMLAIQEATVKKSSDLSPRVLHAVFNEILKPLLKKYEDSMEKCRELAIDTVSMFLALEPETSIYLPYIIPAYVLRLGQKEIKEPAEELRKMMMDQLEKVISLAQRDLSIYVDELTQVLVQTIVDPFPEVKRMGCRCTALLAKAVPDRFHMVSKQYAKPLLATLNHQHAKVRNVCIRAIGSVVQFGSSDMLEDFRTSLAQKTMDHNPNVRKSLYVIAGRWLQQYKERYSYWHKIIPILLSGETDDVQEIQTLARDEFRKAGTLYEQENEETLKEKLEFGSHTGDIPYGCIDLVQQNFSKIYPGLLKDLVDWSADTRRQSARLLYTLLQYEGSHVTMHLAKVLDGLCQGVLDEEDDIAQLCGQCCELIGGVVSVEAWATILIPPLTATDTQTRGRCADLIVVGLFLKTAQLDDLKSFAGTVVSALAHDNVCQSEDFETQEELVLTINTLIRRLGEDCAAYSQDLFNALINVKAASPLGKDVDVALASLATAQQLQSADELYRRHTKPLLEALSTTADSWTKYSQQRRVFTTLLSAAGAVLGQLLDVFMPVFITNSNPDKDVEVRVSFFTLLGRLLASAPATVNSANAFGRYVVPVVNDIICPNLVWRAGEKAAALRTAAMSCLWAMVHGDLIAFEHLEQCMPTLQPLLMSCLEDEEMETRLLTCNILERVIIINKPGYKSSYAGYDSFHKLYPELLKRMDDSNNDIRHQVCRVWKSYFDIMKQAYDTQLYRAHIEMIFSGLILHLDDPDPRIQKSVFSALVEAVDVHPELLKEKLKEARTKHRSPTLCDELIAKC
ncbi:hypothetical protein PTSG_02038 [Salpingoeca rosetta]|uniref:HEAT repeat-containing protein 2 n=1 Tax=Salpingoeca rosetta (strain ATCC 50818 / BSB-021) TaxID=946362 RepID=F2TZP6_SALR5|nr:uncharacterized protein PTSG_02038 [Salpingoeca rosetta]EGD79070.1 hypothetical protein PTSG_02038 [Salpingoeca rosetta]|eukprot:XP_004998026.1 hypothetical protein PTSG_02038 [Salpingoeca rosetta]